MEETYNTKAIILERRPWRERDSMVIVYSLDKGKLELAARGTAKIESKLAGHLEPISLADLMVVRGRQWDYIGGAIGADSYFYLKNDLEKIKLAGRAVNIFNKFIKIGEPDKDIFKLLADFLHVLNKNSLIKITHELFFSFFSLKLFIFLGYRPELYNCVICKKKIKPDNNVFDLGKGGVVCCGCKAKSLPEQLTISRDCIKVLRMVGKNDFNKLVKLKINIKLKKETELRINHFLQYNK